MEPGGWYYTPRLVFYHGDKLVSFQSGQIIKVGEEKYFIVAPLIDAYSKPKSPAYWLAIIRAAKLRDYSKCTACPTQLELKYVDVLNENLVSSEMAEMLSTEFYPSGQQPIQQILATLEIHRVIERQIQHLELKNFSLSNMVASNVGVASVGDRDRESEAWPSWDRWTKAFIANKHLALLDKIIEDGKSHVSVHNMMGLSELLPPPNFLATADGRKEFMKTTSEFVQGVFDLHDEVEIDTDEGSSYDTDSKEQQPATKTGNKRAPTPASSRPKRKKTIESASVTRSISTTNSASAQQPVKDQVTRKRKPKPTSSSTSRTSTSRTSTSRTSASRTSASTATVATPAPRSGRRTTRATNSLADFTGLDDSPTPKDRVQTMDTDYIPSPSPSPDTEQDSLTDNESVKASTSRSGSRRKKRSRQQVRQECACNTHYVLPHKTCINATSYKLHFLLL